MHDQFNAAMHLEKGLEYLDGIPVVLKALSRCYLNTGRSCPLQIDGRRLVKTEGKGPRAT